MGLRPVRSKIHVGLVGFGSQGRRIARAISCQEDMEILGVALNQPDVSAHLAFRAGYPIYCLDERSEVALKKSGISSKGSIESLISEAEIIVDCAPSGVGKQNKPKFYEKSDAKVIFQAGEEPDIAEIQAFLSVIDFERARKAKFVRMASPLAVSIARVVLPIREKFGVQKILCSFVRAGSETMRAQQGPVDTMIPEPVANLERVKWELNQLLSGVNVSLSSVRVPSIIFDVQLIFAELREKATAEAVMELLTRTSRIVVVSEEIGLSSTDSLFEFFRRVRPFSADMYEVCVWKEQTEVQGATLKLTQAVDPHSAHIPEVMDAIRALTTKNTKEKSTRLTDKALNILVGAV